MIQPEAMMLIRTALALVFGYALLSGQGFGQSAPTTAPAGAAQDETAEPNLKRVSQLIVEQTNAFRAEEKLEPVKPAPALQKAADYFAAFMARTDEYGHEADGARPSDRAKKHGYEFCIVTENIAYQQTSGRFGTDELATRFTEGWKNSPGHRKNMIDPDVMDTAVSVVQSEKTGRYYAVQLFGLHQSRSINFSITNNANATARYRLGEQDFDLPPRTTRTHEQCRPDQIAFQLRDDPAAPNATRSFTISRGARYTITGRRDALQVRQR